MTDSYRKWLVLLAGLIFFMLDRLTKNLLASKPVLADHRFIGYFENKNLAFSLPLPHFLLPFFYFFIILAIFVIFGLLINSWRHGQRSSLGGYWFIFLGAVSNLIDRLRFGAVIDFIDLKFWPVFNLADIMIVAGIFVLIFIYLRPGRQTQSLSWALWFSKFFKL